MIPRLRMTGLLSRRVLASVLALAQVLGSVGIVPAWGYEDVSSPYPCQNRPCGCHTAAKCWSGACCCFSMREKVAWAFAHGVSPPDNALRLAENEPQPERTPGRSCCAKHSGESTVGTTKDRCSVTSGSAARPDAPDDPPATSDRVNWVASILAQQCRGEEPGTLILLSVAIPPSLPACMTVDAPCLEWRTMIDHDPTPHALSPTSPPPRSC